MSSRPLGCSSSRVFGLATVVVMTLLLGGCGPGDSSGTGDASNGNAPPTTSANGDLKKGAGTQPDSAKGNSSDNSKVAAPPILAGWEKPAAAIVVSGEQHGYFEPCGCTAMQTGGMSRRGDLFKQLAAKGWPVTAVDVGGSTSRDGAQTLIKFQTILDAMRAMNYRALAVGPEELRLGLDNLLQKLAPTANDPNPEETLSLVCANVVFYDSPELGTPRPWRIIKVGDVKIGVTAILGQDFEGTALLSKNISDLKIKDPAKALPVAIEELKKQSPDVLLLLSHTSLEESRSLTKKFPEFDIVVSAGGPEDPDGTIEKIGKSMLFCSGRKGKSVSVLGFYPNAKEKFRYEQIEMRSDRFKDSPQIVELMRAYQGRLKEEKIAGNHPDNVAPPHPSGATFVGAEKCGNCHKKAFEKWKESKHSHGFESLEHPRAGEPDYGITRVFDAECLACHVAGWEPQRVFRYNSGFINAEFAEGDAQKTMSKLLKGVQCENCHGPGSKHVELVDKGQVDEAKPLMRLTLETARKDLCFNCHDSENSPHFDFDKYWPQIAHPGLD